MMITSFLSCSHIDDDNRLIDVPHAKISRAVLVEEFTGQRCVNCPNAATEIERLQKEYGKENVIAVAIHSGPLAIYSTDKVLGLRTTIGDEYYDYWRVEAEPSGLINRSGGVLLLDKWASKVHQDLQNEAPVELSAKATIADNGQMEIGIDFLAVKDFSGKLQVRIIEDGIVALQMLPDGTLNREYVHNHILRSAVNGTWGDDVVWSSGKQGILSFSAEVQDEWNTKKLSVVAFVYNEKGVLQVCKEPVVD
jgi:hypothetical protein